MYIYETASITSGYMYMKSLLQVVTCTCMKGLLQVVTCMYMKSLLQVVTYEKSTTSGYFRYLYTKSLLQVVTCI